MYITASNISASTTLFPGPSALTHIAPFSVYDLIATLQDGDGDSSLQRWSSFIGIVTAITGNILISFALNIQRYAHIRLHRERLKKRRTRILSQAKKNSYGATGTLGDIEHDEDSENDPLSQSFRSVGSQITNASDNEGEEQSSYLKSPYWWSGILLMTIGEAGNFLAYGFAPASIVSPLGVVALVSNCVIAPIMLKEHFRMRDFWGVVVAIGGAVTVVLSAKQEEKKLGPHEVWGAITRLEFEIYMAVTVSLIAILMWASPKYGSKTVLIDLGLVGLFGGYTALSTKGVASMLSATLWRALATPVTYALVLVLVGTALMQVKYVNRALQRFDSTQVIPVQFVMFTLSVIIGSAILYRDFESTTPRRVSKFIGGCLLTFFGVFLITSGRASHDDDDDDYDDAEEGTIALLDNEAEEHQRSRRSDSIGIRPASMALSQHDGIDEENASRQSRVSFATSPSRPQSPKRLLSDPGKGLAITLTPSAESEAESETFLRNPWENDAELPRPSLQEIAGSSSAPVLPSEAQLTPRDVVNSPLTRSNSHSQVITSPNMPSAFATPLGDTRPSTPVRNSLSLMMPSPLISTLTSPMSAVVADTLMRGMDSPRSKSVRRQRSMRRTRSGSQRMSEQPDLDDHGLNLPDAEDTDAYQADTFKRSRARSLSNTLGDWFGSLTKNQRKGSLPNEDEIANSSGRSDEPHSVA